VRTIWGGEYEEETIIYCFAIGFPLLSAVAHTQTQHQLFTVTLITFSYKEQRKTNFYKKTIHLQFWDFEKRVLSNEKKET